MVGSTNHLDRLDPGIAKRPSRFDRKYLFSDPDEELRTRYAEFWRKKVLDRAGDKSVNDIHGSKEKPSLEFPEVLCKEIARITKGFSFAYMQEAFVSTLLKIAADQKDEDLGYGSRAEMQRLSEQWELLDLEDQDEESGSVGPEKEKGGHHGGNKDGERKDLDKYLLWKEIKVQVEMLRKEMSKDRGADKL